MCPAVDPGESYAEVRDAITDLREVLKGKGMESGLIDNVCRQNDLIERTLVMVERHEISIKGEGPDKPGSEEKIRTLQDESERNWGAVGKVKWALVLGGISVALYMGRATLAALIR